MAIATNTLVSEGLILRRAMMLAILERERTPRDRSYEIRIEYPDDLNDRILSFQQYDETVLQPAFNDTLKRPRPVSDSEWRGGNDVQTEEYDGINGRICRFFDLRRDECVLRIDLRVTNERNPDPSH